MWNYFLRISKGTLWRHDALRQKTICVGNYAMRNLCQSNNLFVLLLSLMTRAAKPVVTGYNLGIKINNSLTMVFNWPLRLIHKKSAFSRLPSGRASEYHTQP